MSPDTAKCLWVERGGKLSTVENHCTRLKLRDICLQDLGNLMWRKLDWWWYRKVEPGRYTDQNQMIWFLLLSFLCSSTLSHSCSFLEPRTGDNVCSHHFYSSLYYVGPSQGHHERTTSKRHRDWKEGKKAIFIFIQYNLLYRKF